MSKFKTKQMWDTVNDIRDIVNLKVSVKIQMEKLTMYTYVASSQGKNSGGKNLIMCKLRVAT